MGKNMRHLHRQSPPCRRRRRRGMAIQTRRPLIVRQCAHACQQSLVRSADEPNMIAPLNPVNAAGPLGLCRLRRFCSVNFRIAQTHALAGKCNGANETRRRAHRTHARAKIHHGLREIPRAAIGRNAIGRRTDLWFRLWQCGRNCK